MTARGDAHWEAQACSTRQRSRDEGTVHLFYRAIGADGVSRIGYASSKDGGKFDRLPWPVFALANESEEAARMRAASMSGHAALVASGGSWGGVEDPARRRHRRPASISPSPPSAAGIPCAWASLRSPSRTCARSAGAGRRRSTFRRRARCTRTGCSSPKRSAASSPSCTACTERRADEVLIDHLDTLDTEPRAPIQSPYRPRREEQEWDSTLRGAGPPPLKTDKGWLLLYHAIDHREPSRYKVGALLLDKDDPTRVIARAKAPVLSPDATYENDGAKHGIVYACGAILRGDSLHVYYGGSDSVICMAKHSLSKLLSLLVPEEPGASSFFTPPLVLQNRLIICSLSAATSRIRSSRPIAASNGRRLPRSNPSVVAGAERQENVFPRATRDGGSHRALRAELVHRYGCFRRTAPFSIRRAKSSPRERTGKPSAARTRAPSSSTGRPTSLIPPSADTLSAPRTSRQLSPSRRMASISRSATSLPPFNAKAFALFPEKVNGKYAGRPHHGAYRLHSRASAPDHRPRSRRPHGGLLGPEVLADMACRARAACPPEPSPLRRGPCGDRRLARPYGRGLGPHLFLHPALLRRAAAHLRHRSAPPRLDDPKRSSAAHIPSSFPRSPMSGTASSRTSSSPPPRT